MKYRKTDYTDVKQASFWVVVIVGIFFALYFLAPKLAHAGSDTWVIQAEAGDIYDSITYEHYMGGSSAPDSSGLLCLTCTGYSQTLTVSDSLYHFYYMYFWANGDTLKGAWPWFKPPSDTTGLTSTITFPLRAHLPFEADSVGVRWGGYQGTVLQESGIVSPSATYSAGYTNNYTINTGYHYNYTVDIYQAGVDSLLTWSFQVNPTTFVAAGGLTLPSDTDLVNVYGWLETIDGNPIKGAVVQATRRVNEWGIGGSPSVIVPQVVGWAESDTLGLFQLTLRRTGSYSDTTKGFYDIVAVHGTNQLFKIEKLYIPDVDSLSIADSLSGRE